MNNKGIVKYQYYKTNGEYGKKGLRNKRGQYWEKIHETDRKKAKAEKKLNKKKPRQSKRSKKEKPKIEYN